MNDKELLIKTLNDGNFDEITFEYDNIMYSIAGWYVLEYEIDGKEYSYGYETIEELLNAKDLYNN